MAANLYVHDSSIILTRRYNRMQSSKQAFVEGVLYYVQCAAKLLVCFEPLWLPKELNGTMFL